MLNVLCELSHAWARQNFPAPLKVEQTLAVSQIRNRDPFKWSQLLYERIGSCKSLYFKSRSHFRMVF